MTLVITRASVNYFNAFFVNHMMSYGLNENDGAFMMSVPNFSCIFFFQFYIIFYLFFFFFFFNVDIITLLIIPVLI
jgi:hypothetical protein